MNVSKTKKPLAVYVRVSRVGGRDGENFISPNIQRKDAARYAASRGFVIAEALPNRW